MFKSCRSTGCRSKWPFCVDKAVEECLRAQYRAVSINDKVVALL